MDGALAWVSEIARWIGQFVPRWEIVDTTQGAVKFVRGSQVHKLGPGWHVYWPLTTRFNTYPIVRQATDLRPQSLVTLDDRSILVGGLIVYEIHDVEAILARTFDPDDTIKDISLSAIHDVCCQKTWDELKQGQRSGALDRELRREAKKGLDDYGVRVLKMTLTDLAPCRVLKLVQSTSKEVGS
jgi:regulator of protease activity HflC (stomatin/prohibitin superfamily)